jgi:DNA-binding response OmpR family regulator
MSRVLVVDDDFHFRSLIVTILEKGGLFYAEAETTTEAFNSLDRFKPDALVVDWCLKETMDGTGLIRAIRRRPGWAGVPAMLISARRSSENDEAEALKSGVNLFMGKGELAANHETFLRHLKALIRAAGGNAAAAHDFGGLRFTAGSGSIEVEGREVLLNPKEGCLLEILTHRPGVTHAPEQLWAAAWSAPTGGDWHHVLDNRISSLRRKLGRKWGARLVCRKGQGYLFDPA